MTTMQSSIIGILLFLGATPDGPCQNHPRESRTAAEEESVAKLRKQEASVTSQSAGDASRGDWGGVSEGFQLSVSFRKNTFTNGEPIVAFITLRNATNRALKYFVSPHRWAMTIDLMRGQEQLERKDLRPKPGASFEERMKYVTAGSAAQLELAPGKEKSFSMQLKDMYDLTPGDYVALAKRRVPKLSAEDADVEVSSALAKFRIISAATPTSASPDGRREDPK